MKKFLLFVLAFIALGSPVTAMAESSEEQTQEYDCLVEQTAFRYEAAKRAKEPQYLYTTLVIFRNTRLQRFGTSAGWFVVGSYKEACGGALSAAMTAYPQHEGWVPALAVAFLVPDGALREGLKH